MSDLPSFRPPRRNSSPLRELDLTSRPPVKPKTRSNQSEPTSALRHVDSSNANTKSMKTFLLYFAGLIAFAVLAPAAEVVNIDKSGLALQGYDPVAYFTDGKPVKGSPEFTATHKGATYQFASAEHKQQFESSPAKYEPQFGGFCGYAASINKLAPIEVQYFQVLHDRLILQHNEKAWKLWHQDVEGNLKKADANWPTLSQQKPPAS